MTAQEKFFTDELRGLADSLTEKTRLNLSEFAQKLQDKNQDLPEADRVWPAMAKVWVCSQFVADSCLRNPDMLLDLITTQDLFQNGAESRYLQSLSQFAPNNEAELMVELRHFRCREMVRIAWRDLAGWADLDETLLELSKLADACIDYALNFLYQQACEKSGTPVLPDGTPQHLIVLGMGKLGAFELNFSSDVDLIFAYAAEGELSDRKQTAYSEFFARLGRRLVNVLDEITVDGFVFRIDLRLRPFGDSGPIVMSLDGMENYYLTQAREWERYAMIKARQVAGDPVAGPHLMAMLQPFIYRRYLDYGAFDEIRELKFQISQELQRKDKEKNIKLGPGGIREIEFIGQAFQLIRGGREKQLRRQQILHVLAVLAELDYLSAAEVADLTTAYRFLRRLENRIQQYQDRQTHDLPLSQLDLDRLAFAMGYTETEDLLAQLQQERTKVHDIFETVFSLSDEQDSQTSGQEIWVGEAEDKELRNRLVELNYKEPVAMLALIKGFKKSAVIKRMTRKGRRTLDRLLPCLLESVPRVENADTTLKRILVLLETVAGRNVYLALLSENHQALTQLIKLTSASQWIGDYLAHYPVLFDELLDTRSLYDPLDLSGLQRQLQDALKNKDFTDIEQLMIALRQFKHLNVLRVAASDIMDKIPVTVVSDYLTWIAEAILEQVVNHCWLMLTEKHGTPPGVTMQAKSFAVLGLGKLGGIELGYGSDLDMVFLYHCDNGNAMTDGKKPITSIQFYGNLGLKIIHMLNTNMLSGILYEVDMRLRPSGNSGLLANHIKAYEDYLLNDAWTWEHQALIRGRYITGDPLLAKKFSEIRGRVLSVSRDREKLKSEIREMRQKMRENLAAVEKGYFDLKHSKGGIADIEFIVQFRVLAHATEYQDLLTHTDTVQLIQELRKYGVIAEDEANKLIEAYYYFRNLVHKQTLQGHRAMVEEETIADVHNQVIEIWQATMECQA